MNRAQFDSLLRTLQEQAQRNGEASYGTVAAKRNTAGRVRLFYLGKRASTGYLRLKLADGR